MANRIDNKVFKQMLTAADADVTAANLFPQENSKSWFKDAHNALMVAGFTPGLGNIADAADALLYALEGEFGDAAVSTASMLPLAGQLVSARKAAKIVKRGGKSAKPDIGYMITKDLKIDGKPAGYITGKVTPIGISVNTISVKPKYQRLGFGTDLYKSLQEETSGLVYSHGWQQNIKTANKVWESLVKSDIAGKVGVNMEPIYYLKKEGLNAKQILKDG